MQNFDTYLEQVPSVLLTWGAGPTHQDELTYITDRPDTIEYSYNKRIVTPHSAIFLNPSDIKDTQQFIYNYGAIVSDFNYSVPGNNCYNEMTHAQYRNEFVDPDQFITIIGWDDEFSKTNFNAQM